VVLLAGEPGVGKTHLARAGAERAAGARVSWGACRESEGPLPCGRGCRSWAGRAGRGSARTPPTGSACTNGSSAPGTGKSAEMDIHHWWRFRDGKIYYYRGTEDTAATAAMLSA